MAIKRPACKLIVNLAFKECQKRMDFKYCYYTIIRDVTCLVEKFTVNIIVQVDLV